jgi:hypothetical protein
MMTDNPIVCNSPIAHVIERLRTSQIVSDPYPHYYLKHVFPEAYYQALLRYLPDIVHYQNLFEVTTLKLDHFRFRDQRDLNDGWIDTLPNELCSFWNSFNEWFLGPVMAQAVLHTFGEPLRLRFGEEERWPEVSVEAQLIRHKPGFFLGPHSDLHTKLVVVLFYLPPDESAKHLGTSIYRPKDPNFTCPDSAHYPFEDFVKVKTAPYLPNSLLAFERSDRSFHGVEPLVDHDVSLGNRDLIQYVLYDKPARQAQLNARRLEATKGAAE